MATLESIEVQIEELTEHIDEKLDAIEAKFNIQRIHTTCSVCQGSGEVDDPVNGEPGPPYECPQCGGDGHVGKGRIDTIEE